MSARGSLRIYATFTADPLANLLRREWSGESFEFSVAPFNGVAQLYDAPAPEAGEREREFLLVWVDPAFVVADWETKPIEPADLAAFRQLLHQQSGHYHAIFVPTLAPLSLRHESLLTQFSPKSGRRYRIQKLNTLLAEVIAEMPNVYLLDYSAWVAGDESYVAKTWYLARQPFHLDVFRRAARDLSTALRFLTGNVKKVVVTDLDNTLWGGEVGEVGLDGIRLGAPDPVGEAFVDVQHQLKAWQEAGIALAVCSKNNAAAALAAIRDHPEMVLREDDFVSLQINWRDKAANIQQIARDLNVGLDSIIFLDDQPAERDLVRSLLPNVVVPDLPKDPCDLPLALRSIRELQVLDATTEDREKTRLFQMETQRTQLRQSYHSVSAWKESLQLRVAFEPLTETTLERAAQLLNKTNQMNLRTRRMGPAQLWKFSREPGVEAYTIRVTDRFGDYGLTGLLCVRCEGPTCNIEDLLLSCRVLGRGVEERLATFIRETWPRSALHFCFRATEKNKVCETFLAEHFAVPPTPVDHPNDLG